MRLSFLALAAVAAFTSAPSHAAQLTYASPAVFVTNAGADMTIAVVSLHFDRSQTASKETDPFGQNFYFFENAVDLVITANSTSVSVLDLDAEIGVTSVDGNLNLLDGADRILRANDPDLASDLTQDDDLSLGEIISPLTGSQFTSYVRGITLVNTGAANLLTVNEYFGDFASGAVPPTPIPLPAGFVLLASGLGVLGMRKSLLNRR